MRFHSTDRLVILEVLLDRASHRDLQSATQNALLGVADLGLAFSVSLFYETEA